MKESERETHNDRWVWGAFAAICVAGLALRLFDLNKADMEMEQARWYFLAIQNTHEMWKWLRYEYMGSLDILVKHVLAGVSRDTFFLKIYQLLLFPLVAWYLMRLSTLLFKDAKPGLLGSLILALSPLHVMYTQMFRYHALVTFLATGAVSYYGEYVVKGNKRALPLFGLFAAAAGISHYYALVLLPALIIGTVAACGRTTVTWKRMGAAALSMFVFSIPAVPLYVYQVHSRVGGLGLGSLKAYVFSRAVLNVPDAFFQFILGGHYPIHEKILGARVLLFGVAGLYAVIVVAAARLLRSGEDAGGVRFLLVATTAALVLPFFSVPIIGILYIPKYLLPFVPCWFLVLGRVITGIRWSAGRWIVGAWLLVLMVGSLAMYYPALGPRPGYREAFRVLSRKAEDGDAVVMMAGYFSNMTPLYPKFRGMELALPQVRFTPEAALTERAMVTEENMKRFTQALKGYKRVWVFYGDGTGEYARLPMDPKRIAYRWFESHYRPVEDFRFYATFIKPLDDRRLGLLRLYVPLKEKPTGYAGKTQ